MRIDTNLAESVIIAVAKQLGFHVAFDRRPDVDEWELSSGHGDTFEQITGTRASISAFLEGYAAMNVKATALLNDLDNAHRRLIVGAREKLGMNG